ncbi:MAG: hypothetical protein JWP12_1609 [Bacteroidetes bacterium]|nr:hypothetical protein [Bacteroidota bacterium]
MMSGSVIGTLKLKGALMLDNNISPTLIHHKRCILLRD